ncbi:MAG: hypothetical protein PWQ11_404 [Candidatus Diapherotrites archaeon]|nr:hypothetical protein [Candidatus Diapherotrites archaeon]
MNVKEYGFLVSSVILAYALFFFVAPLVSAYVNDAFYNGQALYRLTWSHYFFPIVGAIATFLIVRWFRDEINWPNEVMEYVVFLAGALVVTFLAFVLGVQAYYYTFVLYGSRAMTLGVLWNYFLFTPFWAVLPGVLAGWLGAFLAYYKQ